MLRTRLRENQHETNSNQLPPQTRISLAHDSDRDSIYALRHQVYAEELHQHPATHNGMLGDWLAAAVMDAAGRWAEEGSGTHLVAMGRIEVLSIYFKHGFEPLGHRINAGAVTFELLSASMQQLRATFERRRSFYHKLEKELEWGLPFPFFKPPCCFHGGASFDAIGTDFETLEHRNSIVNADVLDAWFPPSPIALNALHEHLPWLMRTSPPAQCEGLRRAIARHRGVSEENILPGAGSSALIYLAFRHWLNRNSRVLVLGPMYGEYVHILENVIGCQVDRMVLPRRDGHVGALA